MAGSPRGPGGGSRWSDDASVTRGPSYDVRFERLAATGADVHGEAALVAELAPGRRVLDAGCGTGRVAIELHRLGFDVEGIDLDPEMLDAARAKAPDLTWHQGDLADLGATAAGPPVDVVVLAGNVLIFVAPGTEPAAVAGCAARLAPGGLLVAGFQVRPHGYGPERLDDDAAAAGLRLQHRWAGWGREPWSPDGGYQVSVHDRPVA